MSDWAELNGKPGVDSAATMHEAAGRRGALPHTITAVYDGARVIGSAYPVLCPVGDNRVLVEALYAAGEGDVLVVATSDRHPVEYGYWGEIMAVAAQQRGIRGLVIDGGVRDTVEMRERGFAVFAAGVSIRGLISSPDEPRSIGEPIEIGGVPVVAGDLVVGDADGVVVVPRAEVPDVVAKAARRVEQEQRLMAHLQSGGTIFNLPPR